VESRVFARWSKHQARRKRIADVFAGSGGRLKKSAIVALARKLLIALWKYVNSGVVIEGAIIKAA
jgi:transposase